MADREQRIVPAVSRVLGDTIVELVYDPKRQRTAFIVARNGAWHQVDKYESTSDEMLVPYAPTNNLIAHECVLLPREPRDCGGKAALLRAIESYLHAYVDFSPLFEKIAAHYVLLTWLYDAFNEIPLLRMRGEYGSGKTRALVALGSIAYKGFFASGSSTVSPIFHTLDQFGGTLLLDEADLRFSDKTADLIKILNSSTVRGLPILRTLTNRHREFNPAAFTVYGPKIVAMRGTFRDQALESRFITELMGTRPLRSDIPLHLPESLKRDAAELRNRLLHFRLTNLFATKSRPERIVSGIDPRLNQTALSLLSLIDDEDVREDIGAMLRERQAAIVQERTAGAEARVLSALRDALALSDGVSISLRQIALDASRAADEMHDPVSAREAGRILRSFAIPLHKSHGAIVVPRKARETVELLAKRIGI